MKRRSTAVFLVLGVLLWIAAPIAALAYLVVRSGEIVAVKEEPIWVSIQRSDDELSAQVGIAMEWAPSAPLRAPGWAGTVQVVYLEPGDSVESGTRIVRIDGIDRTAFTSAMPFVRRLDANATGEDVRMLHDLLSELGIPNPGGERFTWATGTAVAEFNRRMGGDVRNRSFDPAMVVWLAEPLAVSSVELHVGALAPGPGTVFAEARPVLARAFLVDAGDISAILRMDPGTAISEVIPVLTPPLDSRVQLDGTALNVDSETGEIAENSWGELASAVPPGTRALTARIITPSGGEWRVPAAAVFATTETDQLCVLARDETGMRAIPVTVETRTEGSAIVSGDLSSQMEVALAPPADSRTCSSQ